MVRKPQHFLLSARAKTLSLREVLDMAPETVEQTFKELRWAETAGQPICPSCGGVEPYECRRANGACRYRCKACRGDFSVTSGTLFASHKLSLRVYLLAIVIFCNEVKGKSMLAFSRDLGTAYKTAFVLAHKLREAMSAEFNGREIGGEGIKAELDSAYFGGYRKPKNRAKKRVDRRSKNYHTGKRQCLIILRERKGLSLPRVFQNEGEAIEWIIKRVKPGTILHADDSVNWNILHSYFEMRRINHQEAYSTFDACSNQAESYFSRLRRSEIGHHHHVAGRYLIHYAKEMAWREDYRRSSNGAQARRVIWNAMRCKPSANWEGYWRRRQPGVTI